MSASIDTIRNELHAARSGYTALLERGKDAMAKGDLDLAERELQSALGLCPGAPEAQAALREVTGVKQAADELVNKIESLQRCAQFTVADRELTRIARSWKKWPCLSGLREAVRTARRTHNAAFQVAERARQTGDLDQAMRTVKAATDCCPDSEAALDLAADIELDMALAEAHVNRACDLFLEGRPTAARKKLALARRIWASVPGASDAEQRFGTGPAGSGGTVPIAHGVQKALIDVAAVHRRLEPKQEPRMPKSEGVPPTSKMPLRIAKPAVRHTPATPVQTHSSGPAAAIRSWICHRFYHSVVKLAELPTTTFLGNLVLGKRRWGGLLAAFALNTVQAVSTSQPPKALQSRSPKGTR